MKNLLVVGARSGSIGRHVAHQAGQLGRHGKVMTAGEGHEDAQFYVDSLDEARGWADELFTKYEPPHDVVCTVGVNHEGSLADPMTLPTLMDDFTVNVMGPLVLLEAWINYWRSHDRQPEDWVHFVVLSSNSAGVVRSTGLPYNTTKAALSMAVRCVARREAVLPYVCVYGYEPGWVEDTPMSVAVEERLPAGTPFTRTPGNRTLRPEYLADMIVQNLFRGGMLNGTMLRIDGGEC